jgi:hypothetical protein
MIKAEQLPKDKDLGGNFARWVGVLLPPVSWAIQVQTLWLTTEYGCLDGNFNSNHIVSIAALICSMAGGLIAWTYLPDAPAKTDKEKGTPMARKRFMGLLGIVLSVFFSVVVIALWLPTLTGVPCPK